uniref:F-box domain-containing protein n=1 Tax=Candidatus Kentrum sp. SD TaxID=2126332 RepID=A0A451BJT1_9GAMM|nr:MAG: hypothetical protein BECKSD772D_GA0070982_101550 [Candidatus Kentron sp. SD]
MPRTADIFGPCSILDQSIVTKFILIYQTNRPLGQTGLFQQLLRQALTKILLWMRYADVARFCRVSKNMMASSDAAKNPSIVFQPRDEFFAIHDVISSFVSRSASLEFK